MAIMIEKVIGVFVNQTLLQIRNRSQPRRGHDRLTKRTTKDIDAERYEYGLLVLLTIVRRPDTSEDIKSLPALAVTIVL